MLLSECKRLTAFDARSLAAVPRDLWDRYELSVSETVNLDSDALADFAYPCVPLPLD